MADRGQLTIEGLLVIGFFILLFVGVSFPAMSRVYKASNDAASILEGRQNLDKITSGILIVRADGPGSKRTINVKSSTLDWSISAYDVDNPDNDTLTYWMRWNSTDAVPSELINDGYSGGIGKNSIDGISTSGTESSSGLLDAETYSVRIENDATSDSPTIEISASGSIVSIRLVN